MRYLKFVWIYPGRTCGFLVFDLNFSEKVFSSYFSSKVLTEALFRTPSFRAPPAGKAADGAGSTFAILNLFSFDTMNDTLKNDSILPNTR